MNQRTGDQDPLMPPIDSDDAPSESNPVPLSPTDPKHRMDQQNQDDDTEVIPAMLPFSGNATNQQGTPTIGAVLAPKQQPAHEDEPDPSAG